ncbi:hypothetical protein [Candidatus Palauibacter sp.]|uniref:hypothetical protein n=1 Tax=Candidatus Palauibacter sp. TaxID=3101350 RepID=UPI003B026EF6
MPDLEGVLPIILIMIFLWVRSIGSAMKRNRERQEQALAQAEGGPEAFPDRPEPRPGPSQTDVAPPRTKRPSLREQLLDMGRQLEQQMQQAAEEGRPGSMVGHVEPGEAPEMPGMLRRPPPPSRPPAAAPSPTLATPAGATPRRPPPPPLEVGRPGRAGEQPLERLERYPPLARAVILSEIIGPPPGLPRDREE